MQGFIYLKNVATLKLNRDQCIGCGMCVDVCPHVVLRMTERKAEIINLHGCMECGACAKNCPVDAIKVDAGVGCASGLINEWLMSLKIVRKDGGTCC